MGAASTASMIPASDSIMSIDIISGLIFETGKSGQMPRGGIWWISLFLNFTFDAYGRKAKSTL
jgi:hypothetical protein